MAQPVYGAMYCNAAESDAVLATITVFFIASASFSFAISLLTELALCPIATYTQITSLSR